MKLKQVIEVCTSHTWCSVYYKKKKYIGMAKYRSAANIDKLIVDENFELLGNKEVVEIDVSKRGDLIIRLKD